METLTNLAGLIEDAAARHPDKPALLFRDAGLSYRELADHVRRFAGALHALGIAPGERVGLLLYNEPSFVTAYFALLGLGCTVIPLNTRLTAEEVGMILSDAGSRWLISCGEFLEVLKALEVETLQHLVLDGTPEGFVEAEAACHGKTCHRFEALLQQQPESTAPFPAPITDETVAALIYTSGTTGKPKGVMLSHRSLLADARANAQVIEATERETMITISPLFHVFGQTNIMITGLLAGATIVLIRKFSPRLVLEAIERYRVTFMAAVPTMYQMMLSHLRERTYDLSSLRVCHSGASPMPKEVFHQVEALFGAPVQEGYGLSEASSIVTSNPLHGIRKPGSVGLPLPGVTVAVFDDEMQAELPPGEIGELHVKGDIVMMGYYNRPEETAKTLVNGWLKTKDLGYKDEDGYIHIVDRRDDLINIGGVKVYPREIEEVLYRHPAVDAVAVVGLPQALYHSAIKAFVVIKPNESATKESLQAFCRHSLADYKIPKYFDFVTEIPKGATGKILRKLLRQDSEPIT